MAVSKQFKLSMASGLAVLAIGFVPLGVIWLVTKDQFAGLLGAPDFLSGTIGDAVLLPVVVGSAVYLAMQAPPLGVRASATSAVVGFAAGASVQLSWLSSTESPRQWGVPRPWHFSIGGGYHAVFFCLVCATLAVAWRATVSVSAGGIHRHAAFSLLSVSAVAFTASVIFDANRYGGFDLAASVVNCLVTAIALLTIGRKIVHGSWDRVLNATVTIGNGFLLFLLAREVHLHGASPLFLCVTAGAIYGTAVGITKWWQEPDARNVGLRVAVPQTYALVYGSVAALALKLLDIDDVRALIEGEFFTVHPITTFEGWQVLLLVATAILAAFATAKTRLPATIEQHYVRFGSWQLLSLAILVSVQAIKSAPDAPLSAAGYIGAGGLTLACKALTVDAHRFTIMENKRRELDSGGTSTWRDNAGRAMLLIVVGSVISGIIAATLFVVSLISEIRISGSSQSVLSGTAARDGAVSLTVIAVLVLVLVVIGRGRPVTRWVIFWAVPASCGGALSIWMLKEGIPSLRAFAFAVVLFQAALLAADAFQTYIGNGCWLRGRPFTRSDILTASGFAFGSLAVTLLEAYVFLQSSQHLALAGLAILAAFGLRITFAYSVGLIAESKGGTSLTDLQTPMGFVFDELFRWALTTVAIGVPVIVFGATDDLTIYVAAIFATTGSAAWIAPEFSKNNMLHFRSQRSTQFLGAHRGVGGRVESVREFNWIGIRLARSANDGGLSDEGRFVTGLGAHLAIQNVLRTTVCVVFVLPIYLFSLLSGAHPTSDELDDSAPAD